MTAQDAADIPRSNIRPPAIGGLLWLLAVAVAFAPFNAALSLLGVWKKVYASGLAARLTNPASGEFHPYWSELLSVELGYHLVLVPLLLIQLWLFARRSRLFPIFYVGIHTLTALFLMGNIWAVKQILPDAMMLDDATLKSLLALAVAFGVWTPYLYLSDRAHNTFIR